MTKSPTVKGRSWAIRAQLGRGLWGRTFLVETESGHRAVLKCALEKSDFKTRSVELADACQQAAHEQGRLLSGGSQPYLPQLFDAIELDSGGVALLLPHLGRSLNDLLATDVTLSEVFQVLCKAAALLTEAKPILHGNIRPSNIFIREDDSVVLCDVLTVGVHDARLALIEAHPDRVSLTPPESDRAPGADWDPWALCMIMYAATAPSSDTRKGLFDVVPNGLEKVALAALKDRILGRLKIEEANPRFLGRVTEQISKLLNRGLSKEPSPSPPYRFHAIGDNLSSGASNF